MSLLSASAEELPTTWHELFPHDLVPQWNTLLDVQTPKDALYEMKENEEFQEIKTKILTYVDWIKSLLLDVTSKQYYIAHINNIAHMDFDSNEKNFLLLFKITVGMIITSAHDRAIELQRLHLTQLIRIREMALTIVKEFFEFKLEHIKKLLKECAELLEIIKLQPTFTTEWISIREHRNVLLSHIVQLEKAKKDIKTENTYINNLKNILGEIEKLQIVSKSRIHYLEELTQRLLPQSNSPSPPILTNYQRTQREIRPMYRLENEADKSYSYQPRSL